MPTPMQHSSERSCDLLVTADFLLTQDSDRRLIEDAAVAVKDSRILQLDRRERMMDYVPLKTLALGNALLMPGLVNAHTHVAMTFLRGLADDLPLMEWLTGHIFPKEQHLTAEIVALGSLLGCAEMIRTGTTAFTDMYLIESAVLSAVEQSGLRCLAGEGVFAFPSPVCPTAEDAFALTRELARQWSGHERIRIAVMPHTVYTTTPEILERCLLLAGEQDLRLHMHLSETEEESERCLAAYGKRPVAYVRELGLLGPGSSFAHAVDLKEEEMDLLKTSGAHVVHNPRSNMKLASGVAPVPAMLERGILPGLGTDGAASNNGLNMFAEMTACALLHKSHSADPTVLPAQTVLDMATLGSAATMGWPELGSLLPGGPADMIALDLNSPNLQPLYSPVSHAVYAATGHEVRMCMAAGTVLYQDGRWLTLDFPLLCKEAAKLKNWVLNAGGRR